jgi:transposase
MNEIRRKAVMAVQNGQSPEVVIAALGFHRNCIYEWLARYRAGGWDALKTGKRSGRPRKLTGEMMRWIYEAITLGNPMQYQFEFVLWTRKILVGLIQKRFGISLSETSVGRILKQLGLSVQRPLYVAREKNPARVEFFLRVKYPQIRRLAKKMGADIFFEDDAGVSSDHHSGTTWGITGKTPVIRTTSGSRFRFNMVSVVNARGVLRFQVVEGSVGGTQFINFLKALIHDASRPIILIVDGAGFHRGQKVRDFVREHRARLRVFFLPPYSPELNPDEQAWNEIKENRLGKMIITGKRHLKDKISSELRSLQKRTERIQSFFQMKDTKYILEAA